ncbi:MAG: N-acetylmuramic acid 6-phosphate etherase [Steroidobacteraceae bacterium]
MTTEGIEARYADLDSWPASRLVEALLEAKLAALETVRIQAAAVGAAIEAAADRLAHEGRLIYAGAGTSGRVAVQDGVELLPTFGWPRERVAFLMAGGEQALMRAVEGAEDDAEAGRAELLALQAGPSDVVLAVAASGRTPYTVAVAQAAHAAGALVIGIACNPATPLLSAADHGLCVGGSAELIAGSTRLSAGTAQKAVLNAISTGVMVRLGRVYGILMVGLQVTNDKLRRRAVSLVARLGRTDEDTAAVHLSAAGDDVRLAVLLALGVAQVDAAAALDAAAGRLGEAAGALGVQVG